MQRRSEGGSTPRAIWNRVLLKLSGEVLAGETKEVLDPGTIAAVADEIAEVHRLGVQIAVVVGGGNIFRGARRSKDREEQTNADTMGMLATVINALALQEHLERLGNFTRVLTAIKMEQVAEPYIRRRAIRHLEKGRIVILAAGTGNPYFTTDTAAVLRAIECGCDVVLKGTKVEGIHSADPVHHPDAEYLPRLKFRDVLERDLRVMDMTAVTLCMENNLPVVVFNVRNRGNLRRLVQGESIGTFVQ